MQHVPKIRLDASELTASRAMAYDSNIQICMGEFFQTNNAFDITKNHQRNVI